MSVAPNGTTVADYDPTGIGAIVFASVSAGGYSGGNLNLGDNIDGGFLKPAGITGASAIINREGTVLFGTWKCLGFLLDGGANDSASLFMRVA